MKSVNSIHKEHWERGWHIVRHRELLIFSFCPLGYICFLHPPANRRLYGNTAPSGTSCRARLIIGQCPVGISCILYQGLPWVLIKRNFCPSGAPGLWRKKTKSDMSVKRHKLRATGLGWWSQNTSGVPRTWVWKPSLLFLRIWPWASYISLSPASVCWSLEWG